MAQEKSSALQLLEFLLSHAHDLCSMRSETFEELDMKRIKEILKIMSPLLFEELSFFSFGCARGVHITIERNKGAREKYYKFFSFDLLSKKFARAEKSFMRNVVVGGNKFFCLSRYRIFSRMAHIKKTKRY
jgi:hypothetical protein